MATQARRLEDLISVGPAMPAILSCSEYEVSLSWRAAIRRGFTRNSARSPGKAQDICCPRRVSGGGCAGAESAASGRAMPVVVLEPATKGARWPRLGSAS